MSEDMKSQDSDHESDFENMDEDDDYCGYYDNDTDDLDIDKPKKTDDPEYFEYSLLQVEDVERFLNEEVEVLCSSQKVRPCFYHIWFPEGKSFSLYQTLGFIMVISMHSLDFKAQFVHPSLTFYDQILDCERFDAISNHEALICIFIRNVNKLYTDVRLHMET